METENHSSNNTNNKLINILIIAIILALLLIIGITTFIVVRNTQNIQKTNKIDTSQKQTESQDAEIKTISNNITTALETYYAANGFYPPDNHIEYLWSGNRKVMDEEPNLPSKCENFNQPVVNCGINYTTKKGNQGYILKIKYLQLESETIDQGAENSTPIDKNDSNKMEDQTGMTNSTPKLNPVLFDGLTGNPGEQLSLVETIKNPGSKPMLLEISIQNFLPKEGNSEGIPEMTDKNTDYAMKDWISFDQAQIALEPESQKEIKFYINIPSDAKAGGHYAALTFMTKNSDQNSDPNKLVVQSGIGSLVLLRVNGPDIIEKIDIQNIKFTPNYDYPRGDAIYTLIVIDFANQGNVHVKPKGIISIYNEQNELLSKFGDCDLKEENILPASTREITSWCIVHFQLLDDISNTKPYRAEVNGTYGQENTPFSAETNYLIQ